MADFDVAGARAAGFSDAEIEQYLAGAGRSPKEVRSMLGSRGPLDFVNSLASGFRQWLGTEEAGPPQAYTRVTRTPMRWVDPSQVPEGAFGSNHGASGT